MQVAAGEVVSLVGVSGSGKSTLLQIAGLLDTPDSGEIRIFGKRVSSRDSIRTRVRRKHIGFVYQFHHLLPELSALENIMLPQLIQKKSLDRARKDAVALLEAMELQDRGSHRPAELSGGEQQRVAMARALAGNAELILADEPTGNLDPETSARVFSLLIHLVKKTGKAAVIATHNIELAHRTDRTLKLVGGRLQQQSE